MTVFIFYSGSLYLHETTKSSWQDVIDCVYPSGALDDSSYHITVHTLLFIPAWESNPKSSGLSH